MALSLALGTGGSTAAEIAAAAAAIVMQKDRTAWCTNNELPFQLTAKDFWKVKNN